MATPTPSHPPNPSSASKRPNTAHAATTPLVQSTSPAQQQSQQQNQHQQPRSHPSPTATRTSAKTPINYPTATPTNHPTASSTKTFGGTPMIQSLSQQGFNNASPNAVMGPNGTPSGLTGLGLGVDLMGTPGGGMATTPSGMNMGLGMNMNMNMGMGMVPSMSDLGLTLTASGGQKRNEDEERRTKMRRILKKIGRPRGRVSEEGVCRVGRRVGFANDIDAEVLTAEERERKVGNRTVSIAGEAVVVDVELKAHVPREVQVMLSGEGEGLVGLAEKAGEVLLEALRGTESLDGFSRGLEWIARIDRMGGARVNGFEALGGVLGCLRRLFEEEVRGVEQSGGGISREKAEMLVMCRKSGKPAAHERGGLGISLDYWKDERGASSKKSNSTAMDVDSTPLPIAATTPPGLHTLHLDLDRCPPEMYPPIRISSTWLPETLTLDPSNPIPWQEPAPTFLSSGDGDGDGDESMADNNLPSQQPKLLPSLRFLARLDPPLILPWQTATALLNSLGTAPPQSFTTPPILHHLLIPTSGQSADAYEQVKTVLVRRGGKGELEGETESQAKHLYRMHVARPDYGFNLEELPFSHPQQLVECLPLLRQWGCFGALVRDVFSCPVISPGNGNGRASPLDGNGVARLRIADGDAGFLPVDVAFATSPAPILSLAFPSLDGERVVEVRVVVGLDGVVGVSGTVGGGGVKGGNEVKGEVDFGEVEVVEGKKARRWARALEVCGDVGVWVEWVRGVEGV